ncbi:MAG TPA: hypothetical protein VGB62_02120 [Allosphingosinicella sp.]
MTANPAVSATTYADAADLALAASTAAHVRVRDAVALKGAQAAGVPANVARFFIEADVVSLIKAEGALPARIRYLADLPRDAKGKAPRIKKGTEYVILGSAVPGRPGELKLIAPDAQLPPGEVGRVRAILREASGAEAAPKITGIGRAFHVPGAIAGESETQLFLQTEGGDPVSLTVLRRPGETPQWAVALSEIVDQAAEPPARDTLLWYRLACGLPRSLPRQSLAEADAAGAAAIQSDYRLILQELGPCTRSRTRR